MRLLVIAYEFPPVTAAQSLRWFYLANALAGRGVEVEVLCPAMPALRPFPAPFAPGVTLHRTFPGPFIGLTQSVAREGLKLEVTSGAGAAERRPRLTRAYRGFRRLLNQLLFPDLRSEWYPFARRRLKQLLATSRFDLVVSSQEPGVDVLLGLYAKRRFGLPWVIDLGDPLLTPYTPRWRRLLDLRLERRALGRADAVVTTNPAVNGLLLRRHPALDPARLHVVAQGFPDPLPPFGEPPPARVPGRMRLLFTGTFYRDFRSPAPLAEALRSLGGADYELFIAGDNLAYAPLFAGLPQVKFLGKIDHFSCLRLQRECDLLIDIGNVQSEQVPGKVYEYLGARRPILHLASGEGDGGARLIETLGAGEVVANRGPEIAAALADLFASYRNGELDRRYPVDEAALAAHTWAERAGAYLRVLEAVCR